MYLLEKGWGMRGQVVEVNGLKEGGVEGQKKKMFGVVKKGGQEKECEGMEGGVKK